MRTAYNGYLTLYLSLVFGIILSLLVALIEGAAIGATRLQSELVADLGLDSVFAEYHRELLEQYGVFYIDDSYGNEQGSLARVEQHLTDYMRYNCDPYTDSKITLSTNLIKLKQSYLQIEEVSFATDEDGNVWKAQAIDYMKQYYGLSYVTDVSDYVNQVEQNGLATTDLADEMTQRKSEIDDAIEAREGEEIVETDAVTSEGYSYAQIAGLADSVLGAGILSMVTDDVSGKCVQASDYVSHRQINRGNGLRDGIDAPDSVTDRLLYMEYLMLKYGNYLEVKDNGALDYQIEYILYGHDSDVSNLQACAERLVLLRWAADFIYLTQTDAAKKEMVEVISLVITALLCIPECAEALTYVVLMIWAFAEAVSDVRCLFDGGKVPLLKQRGDWHTDLIGLLKNGFSGDGSQGGGSDSGLSYQEYLRILLTLMSEKDRVMRSMDVAEMDIRLTEGNEHFRIDRCISYLKVSLGFEDADGHEYVFTREMGYQ